MNKALEHARAGYEALKAAQSALAERDAAPALAVTGKELGEYPDTQDGLKQLRAAARAFLGGVRGQMVRCEALGRDVEIRRRSIGEMMHFSANPKKLKIIPAIVQIIATAKNPVREENCKTQTKSALAYYRLHNTVTLDGEPVAVEVLLEEDAEGVLHYDLLLERGAQSTKAMLDSSGLASGSTLTPDHKSGSADSTIVADSGGVVNFASDSMLDSAAGLILNLFIEGEGENEGEGAEAELDAGAAAENAAAALKRWFGASKIVDDDGKPLVMYHGSYKDFHAFDRLASAWRGPSIDMVGSWFSSNPGDGGAGMYAPGGAIYPVYLRVTKPKYYDSFREMLNAMHEAEGRDPAQQKPAGRGSPEGLRDQLKAEGFDGIALSQTNVGEQEADLGEVLASIRRAKEEEYAAPASERAMFTAKRERLEGTAKRLRDELAIYGGSTEFDDQTVVIVFDPEQVKSAIGNSGAYDPSSTSMVDSASVPAAAPVMDAATSALSRARVASALAAKVAHYSQGASMPALERMRLAREIRELIAQLGGASQDGGAAAPIRQLQDIARGLKDGADLADLLEQIKGAVSAILAADALGAEAADQADAAITRWAELEEMKYG